MSEQTRDTLEFFAERERVDHDQCVIRGARLLGARSSNVHEDGTSNVYTRAAREAAIPAYEALPVYANHPDQPRAPRKVEDLVGRPIKGTVRDDGEGLRGDVQLDPNHPLTKSILWNAEQRTGVGFSHNARNTGVPKGRDFEVSEINPRSLDVVVGPATTKDFFEQRRNDPMDPKTTPRTGEPTTSLAKLTREELERARPDLVSELRDGSEVEKLQKERDDLAQQVVTQRRERELEKAALPKDAVTDRWRKRYLAIRDDQEAREELDDRKQIAGVADEQAGKQAKDVVEQVQQRLTAAGASPLEKDALEHLERVARSDMEAARALADELVRSRAPFASSVALEQHAEDDVERERDAFEARFLAKRGYQVETDDKGRIRKFAKQEG